MSDVASCGKVFVLDTNVILHDSSCIYQFDEHDIVVPITVLEELDQFKKGNEALNFHAREFARALDSLSGDRIFNGGLRIGPGKGKIRIQLEKAFHKDLVHSFHPDKPDHHILNTAYRIAHLSTSKEVILVTKDVNLRMKAKAVGLLSQDYTTDHVKDVSALYRGHSLREPVPSEVIHRLCQAPFEVCGGDAGIEARPVPHQYFILRNSKDSALARYDADSDRLQRVDKVDAYGITPHNAEQTFALNALLDVDIPLVTVSGKAGTGKTLLALAAALERRKDYRQILLARPIVPLSNRDIGFLPGDIHSKLDPYMQPLYDNLNVIQNQYDRTDPRNRRIGKLLEEAKLVIEPLSYIRGRSLSQTYFIVDEAQNLTPHEVKTIITRAGEGTKVVFTGDIFQIDHPYLDTESNGLSHLIEKMQGQTLYAHVNLEKGERSQLAELASNLL
ncbi:MAG: PhoH family protein [bacterium]|nr:PhoH family protein [bacterium]